MTSLNPKRVDDQGTFNFYSFPLFIFNFRINATQMKNTILLLLFSFSFLTNTTAQDFDTYQPVKCLGKIPKAYNTSSYDKYRIEIAKIENGKSKNEIKSQKEFALENNFVLDDLLQSGLVLFNDEVTKYMNQVAKIVKNKNKNRATNKLKVYTLRSPSVNAFATDRGNIFVTLGLMARLENEAQLAYVLSHEMVHAEHGHSLELFLHSKDIDKESSNEKVLKESAFDENILAKCAYSKDLESEADSRGFDKLVKTNYSVSTLNKVFDVLKYSELPFAEVPFDKHFFESGQYQFPSDFWLEEVTPIAGIDENKEDSTSSHPNIGSRRKALQKRANMVSEEGRKNFVVSEDWFKQAKKTAQFELPMLYLQKGMYAEAIYTANILLQDHPKNLYLNKCIVKALYLNAKNKNAVEASEGSKDLADELDFPSHKAIEGESQQVHFFLNQLDAKESTVLALRTAWQTKALFSQDKELPGIIDDLFLELAGHSLNMKTFQKDPILELSMRNPDHAEHDKKRPNPENDNYWKYAFSGFMHESDFKFRFFEGQEEREKRDQKTAFNKSAEGQKKLLKKQKKIAKKGLRLGIDKVVVINPYYLKVDARKETKIQHIKTEIGQRNFRELAMKMGKKSKLEVNVLDVTNLRIRQSEEFNEIRFLNEYFNEQASQYELSPTQGLYQEQLNAIAKKYGTDHFLWTGTISLRDEGKILQKIGGGLLFPPMLPYSIYKSLKPEYEMLHYAILINIKTGNKQVIKFDYYKNQDTNSLLKSHLYDTFTQIKSKK